MTETVIFGLGLRRAYERVGAGGEILQRGENARLWNQHRDRSQHRRGRGRVFERDLNRHHAGPGLVDDLERSSPNSCT